MSECSCAAAATSYAAAEYVCEHRGLRTEYGYAPLLALGSRPGRGRHVKREDKKNGMRMGTDVWSMEH